MTKLIISVAVCLLTLGISSTQADQGVKESSMKQFTELKEAEWKQVFHDPCTGDWNDNWTLDGLKGTVKNGANGMDFTAGPEAFNDAHHAVLWTKQDFKGALKIEYEYTRLDKEVRMVNIIYIQATGSGQDGFDEDISTWADKRTVPSMRTYFNNMNTYHISYAAFGTKNKDATKDYIRARRYMCRRLKGTELENEYKNTGFFATGVPHKITIVKSDKDIYMHIRNAQKAMLCHFVNSKFPPITEGKIGLRHMYTRGARYKDFKVSVLAKDSWIGWHRPADNNAFITTKGNNHDSILFVEPELEYPYHLIISHTPKATHLWRAKKFSWSSAGWELVSDQYTIGKHYEYDDGVKVNGTYYIYEAGKVYTFSGPLEEASGKWKAAGTFPHKQCNDVGVYYEDGVFHMFGEHGNFPHGPDGTSLAHFTSTTGLGDWKLVNAKAVDPNPEGGHKYGVGDATITKIEGHYYIFCDRESKGSPYKVVAWRSKDLNEPFEYLGKAITPRSNDVDDWDNYRIQDPDIAYIPELGRYVMTCNMKDHDGNPGGHFPTMKGKQTRVIGVFYSNKDLKATR